VLRRSAGGTITDLLPAANVMLGGFYVAPDGNVFVIGMTNTTSDRWFRRYNATGGLATLLGGEVEWVFGFPDGNVYAASIIANQGVHRYLASTAMMDPTVWIGDATATHDATDCGWSECYRIKTPAVRTSTDAVYAVNYKKRLVKLYPALEVPASQVATATLVTAAGAKLAVAGQNASGQYVLYLHDAATGAEQQLIGPASEIELYHLAYSASRNVLVFDGLRFADNKVVLGEVDLASGEVRVTNQLGTKWADLQLFG
jgi:hypothetical protein